MSINREYPRILNTNVQDLDNTLNIITCPVSFEILDKAVILLPCAHRLQQVIAESMYGPPKSNLEQKNKLCPVCQIVVTSYIVDYQTRSICEKLPQILEEMHTVIDQQSKQSTVYKNQQGKDVKYYQQILETKEKILGKDHLDVAHSQNKLASAYLAKKQYNEAIECLKRVLEIGKKNLGKDAPEIASYLNNLGSAYHDQKQYVMAIDYYKQAIEIGEKNRGKDRLGVAFSCYNLGSAYYDQEHYDKAVEYYAQALEIVEKILEKHHPFTIRIRTDLENCKKKVPSKCILQ